MDDATRRKAWIKWWKACRRWRQQRDERLRLLWDRIQGGALSTTEWQAAVREFHTLKSTTPPPPPAACAGLACGAWAKTAQRPCKVRQLYAGARCVWHGGKSSGPVTARGKALAALNGRCPKRKKRTSRISYPE